MVTMPDIVNPLRTEVYFCHHNVKIKWWKFRSLSKFIKVYQILEVYQNPSTLVLIVKLLRQAFKWYHWYSDWDSLGANVSFMESFSKYSKLKTWNQTSSTAAPQAIKWMIRHHWVDLTCFCCDKGSVVAEWLGRHTLSIRGSWVRIPAKAQRGICEQDTLESTAWGSHNKQNCLRHP
jgi:hypothetical protein